MPFTALAIDVALDAIAAAEVVNESGVQLLSVDRDGSTGQNNPSKVPASASSATSNVSPAPRTA